MHIHVCKTSNCSELSFVNNAGDSYIPKLAKRCQIKGKHWSNPGYYDQSFLDKADVSLDKMERTACEVLAEINH